MYQDKNFTLSFGAEEEGSYCKDSARLDWRLQHI